MEHPIRGLLERVFIVHFANALGSVTKLYLFFPLNRFNQPQDKIGKAAYVIANREAVCLVEVVPSFGNRGRSPGDSRRGALAAAGQFRWLS